MDSVGKLTKILKFIEKFILSYLTVHLIGCGWIYLNGVEKGKIFDIYVKAIYWVITTMTTIGYGDITPQTSITRIYTMFVMISGVAVYGFVIGNFSKFLTEENKFKEGQKEKMFNLFQFMKYYGVPKKLQEESIDFMGHISSDRLTDDDSKIISELPETLQNDLKIYMKIKMIDSIPLFQGTSSECQKELSLFLKEKNYSPGGSIIVKGDIGNEMFIIDHGRVEIIINDEIVNTMSDGEFFGEIALIKSTTRMADVKARSYCKIYFLERDDLMTMTKKYLLLDTRIKKMVKAYE
jgi:voltage-gated potassium channel